ncbi:hypothetical protein B0T24DRAFT_601379 [Lasiosphaeria ovina]|uniref:Small ribosomal subunit protein uS11m n=1 Tax=Lasiosphaeria ovina TaxID=92902 RepID=A0AAE0NJ45_9PEZI|nr:hypothetical protein B0T24DRAFT_601379 [Lasiosphaeria ovina]
MSRFSTSRLMARGLFQSVQCQPQCTATGSVSQWSRAFSRSRAALIDIPPKTKPHNPMELLARSVLGKATTGAGDAGLNDGQLNANSLAQDLNLSPDMTGEEPYHFHIYSHRHNTHVTVSKPNRDAIISLSCGNLGFKKSQRKHYDSAYQLGAYVINKMHEQNLVNKIHALEVILRGFGQGREAVSKVLMGAEGAQLRPKIVRVSDNTRLKFGGTRSKKPRRLG